MLRSGLVSIESGQEEGEIADLLDVVGQPGVALLEREEVRANHPVEGAAP